jgi:hypothetical protein
MSIEDQSGFVGKRRDWVAYINVAAKGTLFQPYQRSDPIGMHPKAFANLEYTTADVDYWDDYWRNGDWYGRPPYETHATLRDAYFGALATRLDEVKEWFAESSKIPGFDGGSIVFCYSPDPTCPPPGSLTHPQ